ncbi:MAG: amidohydrolase [Caulobacteraceae bacterium]
MITRFGARSWATLVALFAFVGPVQSQPAFAPTIESSIQSVLPRMVAWRRDFHEHPELSYEEVRTARIVAQHLRSLRMQVRTGVAQTGVVGVLRGARPGPVIALRADMDALPVTEEVDLPFRSHVRAQYNGQEVGVMHACGHDTHVAVLMATAGVLAAQRDRLAGTVIFIFQPSEEGRAPDGGPGGAERMLAENVFGDLQPEAIFGLHAWPRDAGTVTIVDGPFMAGADQLRINVTGRQTHGAQPHRGVDPIVVSAQIINALQTIPSRQMDAVASPVIVTIGAIHGGIRYNIIPDRVEMIGTIRYLNPDTREEIYTRVRRTAEDIAHSAGATVEVTIAHNAIPVVNPPAITARTRAVLQRTLGEANVRAEPPGMVAEDFAYFQQAVPGVFFYYGVNAPGVTAAEAAPNHNPRFFVHEPAMETALRAMIAVALDRVGAEAS